MYNHISFTNLFMIKYVNDMNNKKAENYNKNNLMQICVNNFNELIDHRKQNCYTSYLNISLISFLTFSVEMQCSPTIQSRQNVKNRCKIECSIKALANV